MKKYLLTLVALLLACSMLLALASCGGDDNTSTTVEGGEITTGGDGPEDPVGDGEIVYTLSDDESFYSVSGAGTFKGSVLNIPATYNGKPVEKIDADALDGCKSITELIVPTSVKSIGCGAFRNLEKLEKITIPFIGASATDTKNTFFAYIFGATVNTDSAYTPETLKSVTVTGNIKTVAANAFVSCVANEINLPDSVNEIGNYAFSGCQSLEKFVAPKKLVSIGKNAFNACFALEFVDLSTAPVSTIGTEAFKSCTTLKTVILPSSLENIGADVFKSCKTTLKVYYEGSDADWKSIGSTAYAESFESATAGKDNGAGDIGLSSVPPKNTIMVENGNKFLRLPYEGHSNGGAENSGNSDKSVIGKTAALSYKDYETVTMSFDIRFDGNGTGAKCEMQLATINAKIGGVESQNRSFISFGYIALKNGVLDQNIDHNTSAPGPEVGEWNNIKLVLNLVDGLYDLYVNGELYAKENHISSAGGGTNQDITNVTINANTFIFCKMSKGTGVYSEDSGNDPYDVYVDVDNLCITLPLQMAKPMIYSEAQPAVVEGTTFWHYVDGVPTAW